jgi:glycosyltransferase involved in cell wall biosynthesis
MLYASTDCLILPSGSETWGLVVNEAMAAGLAVVVSSSCGCVEDLVASGDNGFVFDPDDRAGLVAALERLDDDPDLAAKMGQRGREIIGDWSLGRFVEGAQAAANAAKTAPRFPLRRALARVFLALLRLRPDRARGFGG